MKFFRLIRQRLLGEGKLSKYLPYALGEILLVVVGILIALQINNWNETRINSRLELNLLKSCLEGLEKDLSDAKFNVRHHERGIIAMGDVISALESNDPIDKDTIAKNLSDGLVPTYFVYSTSAFETIKAKGVNIISNDSLRDQIIEVYDSRYTFFLRYEQNYLDEIDHVIRNVLPGRFEEAFNNSITEPGFPGTITPIDLEEIRKDPELLFALKTLRNRNNILINLHYNALINSIGRLIDNLKTEITNHEGK